MYVGEDCLHVWRIQFNVLTAYMIHYRAQTEKLRWIWNALLHKLLAFLAVDIVSCHQKNKLGTNWRSWNWISTLFVSVLVFVWGIYELLQWVFSMHTEKQSKNHQKHFSHCECNDELKYGCRKWLLWNSTFLTIYKKNIIFPMSFTGYYHSPRFLRSKAWITVSTAANGFQGPCCTIQRYLLPHRSYESYQSNYQKLLKSLRYFMHEAFKCFWSW